MARVTLIVSLAVCAGLVGCSRRLLSVVLDVPPATAEPAVATSRSAAPPRAAPGVVPLQLPAEEPTRPAIEQFLDPDTVRSLLPRDRAGNIDWMEALRRGVIDPRSSVPGREPAPPEGFRFAYDFYFPGPDSTLKAFFPHSSHTEWMDCQQCHARIFPYRNTPVAMADIFQGKYCGECHGKVAFPVMTDCERCHVNLNMPPNRATPDLIGTVVMARATSGDGAPATDEAPAAGSPPEAANAEPAVPASGSRSLLSQSLPAAQFPHWVHRIRFKCKACHMEIFEPKAGANRVTMKEIGEGKACGACHNGTVAFAAGFGECQRCHVPPAT